MPTIYTDRPHRLEWAALILILALAAFMRLRDPGIVEYKRDEASLSKLVLDIVHGRDFPLLGIDSSVGIRNAPWNVYLMIPPYLLGNNPVLATSYVGLLNVLAVLLVYLITRRYYGSSAALIAGFLYAVSFWAAIYSRKIWAQDLFPPFVLMTIGTALLGFWEGKRWAQFLHLPLLAITGQIHYAAVVLIPITLYLAGRYILKQRKFTWALALSLIPTVLIFIPFIVGAAREGMFGPDVIKKFNSSPTQNQGVHYSPDAYNFAMTTITGTHPDWYFVNQSKGQLLDDFLKAVPDATPLLTLIGLGVLAATSWLLVNVFRRNNRRPEDITLLLWLLLTPLVFSLTWTTVYIHYTIIMLPAAYIVLGVGISDLLNALQPRVALQRVVMAVTVILLVLVAGAQLWMEHAALQFVTEQYISPPGFGIPLAAYLPIRDAILAEKPDHMLALLDGQYLILNEEATIWDALLYELPGVRFLDSGIAVYPAQPTLLLSHDCGDGVRSFLIYAGKKCYALSTRSPEQLNLTNYRPMNDKGLIFANGARLTHYQWDKDKGCLSIVWTVNGQPFKEDFQVGVKFLDSDKQTIAPADAISWQGEYWYKGDTIIRQFCIQDKSHLSEIAGVQLGMYLYDKVGETINIYPQDLYNPQTGAAAGQLIEVEFKS